MLVPSVIVSVLPVLQNNFWFSSLTKLFSALNVNIYVQMFVYLA